jgi:hypothetical protein
MAKLRGLIGDLAGLEVQQEFMRRLCRKDEWQQLADSRWIDTTLQPAASGSSWQLVALRPQHGIPTFECVPNSRTTVVSTPDSGCP